MKSLRYLNTVLTVIAVLLTVNIWTLWTVTPGGDALSMATEARAVGLTDAASQRKQMIDGIKRVEKTTGQIVTLFKSGSARVRLEGSPPDQD